MKNKFLVSIGAGALALSIALPAQAAMFGDWDADKSASITTQEFTTGFDQAGAYDRWDADKSGDISDAEFSAGVFASFDENDDDMLGEDEFDRYVENVDRWTGDAAATASVEMNEWDANSDSNIGSDEFMTGFAASGAYGAWDADTSGSLSRDEFNTGVYAGYDADDDEALNENEFAEWELDRGFWDIDV